MNMRLLILVGFALIAGVVVYLSTPGESAAPAPSVSSTAAGVTAPASPPPKVATASPHEAVGPPPPEVAALQSATTPLAAAAESLDAQAESATQPSGGSAPAQPLRAASGGDGWALAPAPPTKARVSLGQGSVDPINVGGHYQRLTLPSGAEAKITVEVPANDPSRQLLVRAIQGGTINNADNFAVFDLQSGARDISFTFRGGTDPGLSEIILRRGATEEVLQFWTPTASPQYDPPSLSID